MVTVKPIKPKMKTLNKKQNTGKMTKLAKTKKANIKQAIKVTNNDERNKMHNVSLTVTKNDKVKYVYPSKHVTDDLVNSCLTALQQVEVQSRKKNAIFEEESSIFMEIHCIKIQSSKGNVKFILPNSTIPSTREICLITPDVKKGRKSDHEPTIDKWEELLSKNGVTDIKTIVPVRQLKVEYDQFELKRRLLTQHDFIMVDTRVLSHVSHLLGNMFFKKHNMLIPVRLNEDADLKNSIDLGLRTAILRLNEGETSTIIVGHTGMPQICLKENVLSVVDQLRSRYPGGESNIRSLLLKLPLSLSVPLYLTLRPSNLIPVPKLVHMKPKHFTTVEDELSTIQDARVRVGPDGTVKVLKFKKTVSTNKEETTDEEEFEENHDSKS